MEQLIKIYFSQNGVEQSRDTTGVNLVVGNNDVDVIEAYFENRNITEFQKTIVVEKPDGSHTNEMVMVNNQAGTAARFKIDGSLANQAGVYNLTIRLKKAIDGEYVTQCTSIVTITYTEGIVPDEEVHITSEEYDELLDAISEESNTRSTEDEAIKDRLDTAEADIDDLQADVTTLENSKVAYVIDNSTTFQQLYILTNHIPCIIKMDNVYAWINLIPSGETKYLYSMLVLRTGSTGALAYTYSGECNKTDVVRGFIGTIVSVNDNQIQTKAQLTMALAYYYTKTQVDSALGGKVDKAVGKGLSENDFTNTLKTLYDGYDARINAKASQTEVDGIQAKVPSAASSSNQLADKAFVNSSINSNSAFRITYNASGDPFPTKAALFSASTYYSGGEVRVPTRNDYARVMADETQDGAETKYVYENGQWEFDGKINDTPFTQAERDALSSGITAAKVAAYDAYATTKLDKQSGNSKVYVNDGSGNPTTITYSASASANTMAQRGAGGVLQVGTPVSNNDATTKKYVDDRIVNPTLTLMSDGSYTFSI